MAYMITDKGIVTMLNGQHFSIPTDHPNFARIKTALQNRESDATIRRLVDLRLSVKDFIAADRDFTMAGDCIVYEGRPFSFEVSRKILRMVESGNDAEPLFQFLRNVRQNPSRTAQDELLLFCIANDFMITNDGQILAYKSVDSDFKDKHTHTFDNRPGTVQEMARNQVDDNRNVECSTGFHFASYQYARHSFYNDGDHLMLVKVNPRDVVSIPRDYNNQKARCCRYRVLSEVKDTVALPKKEVYVAGRDFEEEDYDRDFPPDDRF